MGPDPVTSTFITAQDGLRLHVRAWGPRLAALLPVVCLPGLARTVADFETLASALASGANGPRSVLALDLRGRGRSDYDRNPKNYNVQVELADVLAVLTALAVDQAVFIGTSRGGILTMLLAVARPTVLAGCVLNDVGPVIETVGLMRIKSYLGKLPQVASLHEAADVLRRLFAAQFPKLSDDDWVAFARRTFKDAGGRIVPDYDVRLGKTLDQIDPARPVPPCGRSSTRWRACRFWSSAGAIPTFCRGQRWQPCRRAIRRWRRSRWRIRAMLRCCRTPP